MHAYEVWIPISMFIGLTIVVTLFIYYRYQARQDLQVTIRSAIEKGQELSPEILERLGKTPPAKDRDLRRGLVGIALGIAFASFGFIIGEPDAKQPMLGIAMFPFMIGIAFLIMNYLGSRD